MKFKQLFFTVGVLSLLVILSACRKEATENKGQVKVGIIQYAKHPALDASRKGFIEALRDGGYKAGKNLQITSKNAQGEQANLQTMVDQLTGKNDLNFAIATPAAQALLTSDPDTPAVFTAVTDPVGAGLVDSMEKPGKNMTGSIDAGNVPQQVALLLKAVPTSKKVGIFYNSSEVNSQMQAKEAKKALKKKGIIAVEKTVTTSNDVQQVMTSLVGQVDAVYLPTDNTVASTAMTIGQILKENKIPAIGSDKAYLDAVLFTSGVDYEAIGRQAGEEAVAILNGKKASTIAVAKPEKPELAINKDMAKSLGLNPKELEKQLVESK